MIKLAMVLMILAGTQVHADYTVALPKPQGGKVICKSGKMAAFIQEYADEMERTAFQVSQALETNKALREELETSPIGNIKMDLAHLSRVKTSASIDGDRLILSIGIYMRMTEQSSLIRAGVLQSGQPITRTILIKGTDNCAAAI